jgi:transposase
MLVTWRRAFSPEQVGPEGAAPGFVPAVIVAEAGPRTGTAPTGRMEIVVRSGRRIIVDAEVDAAALARVLEVVDRR